MMKFNTYNVPTRNNLLDVVEFLEKKDIKSEIGKDPLPWIHELGNVYFNLTLEHFKTSNKNQNIFGNKDFKQLGRDTFIYEGMNNELDGLWIRELPENTWTNYDLGSTAKLKLGPEYKKFEEFLPENFEKIATRIGETKRPILKFNFEGKGVYAKGGQTKVAFYPKGRKPSSKLTISEIKRHKSEDELNYFLELGNNGVKVPEVIGYYTSVAEEYVFVKEIKGKQPDEYIGTHKREIIKQDSDMLAKICLTGLKKQGFTDFDDKVFDGKTLHLIDVDECIGLYNGFKEGWFVNRFVSLEDEESLIEFKETQRMFFDGALKDAIRNYRQNLTPHDQDQEAYANNFYKTLKINPSKKELEEVLCSSLD